MLTGKNIFQQRGELLYDTVIFKVCPFSEKVSFQVFNSHAAGKDSWEFR